MRKRRTKEGNVSIALLDVFFNMMVIFMLAALSASPGSLTNLDVHRNSSQETLSSQKEVPVEINYSKKGWVVRIKGKELVRSQGVSRVVNWLLKNKPPAARLTFSGKERVDPRELFSLIVKAQEVGTQLFYQAGGGK